MMKNNRSVAVGDNVKQWKKYGRYALEVDPDQDDKATEIKLGSFARPHMRCFHCSWWSFFVAFFMWFAITPLLGEIQKSLGLTKEEIWTSSIVGVGGTIFVRLILGPMCDKYGARVLFASVLCLASIPTACTGAISSATGLMVLRLFIGIVGGTFVMCQYWTSVMFAKEIVGTANGIVAGWGNLGAGVTQLVMGSFLFPLFKYFYGGDASKAWRTVCIVPAVIGCATGIIIYRISDDAPKGNYRDLKNHGTMPEVSTIVSFRKGCCNRNTWLLFIQYAACFGVEITMNNATALYFSEEFGQTTESAAAIASIFGWMNLFARGAGGFLSDKANERMGMRGRVFAQAGILSMEGILVLVFAQTATLDLAIVAMIFFSIFVQAAEGTSFGIVPYIDPPHTGSVSGIIGAGGNVGAVAFGLAFRELDYASAFLIMGISILVSAMLSPFIKIQVDEPSRRDQPKDKNTSLPSSA